MKKLFVTTFMGFMLWGCHKDLSGTISCNIQEARTENARKVSVSHGFWGTLSHLTGNCMPVIDENSTCKNCTIKGTINIYEYTLRSDATQSGNSVEYFDSFNSPLVAQIETDNSGFFQADIPNGHYSIAIVQNGKLWANSSDGQGGICPITISDTLRNFDLEFVEAVF